MQRRLYCEFIKIEAPEAPVSGVFNLRRFVLTLLIDWKGIVRAKFQGETDLKPIEQQMAALLAQP
jgi:hypothetical protein